jgi:hypothetical protein
LVHISVVYDFLRPYLAGFYLALHLYQGNRDQDGWPVAGTARLLMFDDIADFDEQLSMDQHSLADREHEMLEVDHGGIQGGLSSRKPLWSGAPWFRVP